MIPSKKPKNLPKMDPETLNNVFEQAKQNNDIQAMLLCTQVALLSELKWGISEIVEKLSELKDNSQVLTEILSDSCLGIEIYPKSDEKGE